MRAVLVGVGVLWLGLVGCGPFEELILGPLTAACPGLSQASVQNLAEVLQELEESGMRRADAVEFAADNCERNHAGDEALEDIAESCEECANTLVTVVYDTF
jgi:uncharacterized protein YoaH (UPF0181 family)